MSPNQDDAATWSSEGDYLEACNCGVACQCLWMEAPDDNICTVSAAWHIQNGPYGGVDLSVLNAAWLVNCEDENPFGPDVTWPLVLLLTEKADDDQQEALEDLFLGRAGGTFRAAGDTHVERVEVATPSFSFDRDSGKFSLDIGDVVAVEAAETRGVLGESSGFSPHPFTKNLAMMTGKSTTATVLYNDEFTWGVSV